MQDTKTFIPMIGDIFINGESWGWVTQAANQTEREFKEEVHAAAAEISREAYREYSKVNLMVSYRLAQKGVDF